MVIGDDIAVLADLDGDGPVFYGVEECHLCAYEGPRHVGLAKVEEHLPKLVDWFAERGGENDRRAGYRRVAARARRLSMSVPAVSALGSL